MINCLFKLIAALRGFAWYSTGFTFRKRHIRHHTRMKMSLCEFNKKCNGMKSMGVCCKGMLHVFIDLHRWGNWPKAIKHIRATMTTSSHEVLHQFYM